MIDGRLHAVAEGESLEVPPDTWHTWVPVGEVRMRVTMTPALGLDDFLVMGKGMGSQDETPSSVLADSKGDCKAPEIVHGEAIRGWRSVLVGSCPGSTSGVSFLRGRLSDVVRGRISLPVTGRHRYLWGRGGEIWGLGRDSSDDLVSRHQVGSTTDLGWPYQTKNPLHWFPGVPRERGYRAGFDFGGRSKRSELRVADVTS
jgi:hypothetical protein